MNDIQRLEATCYGLAQCLFETLNALEGVIDSRDGRIQRAHEHLQKAINSTLNQSHSAKPITMVQDKPPSGEWRYSNGLLYCGTLRIATEDFDTDPSTGFRESLFKWICETLNGPCQPPPAGKASK